MNFKADKRIAYTLGEPAGIGADILLQLADTVDLSNITIVGDKRALEARAQKLGLPIPDLAIKHIAVASSDVCGEARVENSEGVLSMLDYAIDGCISGEFSGMVTGPLHKGVINDAGIAFSGHTEYLAERTGAKQSVMMLATSSLRVGLYTTHLPLKDVSAAINEELIERVTKIVDEDLKSKFGIEQPKILICGLNPHAGEGGHLGHEEIEVIEPAVESLQDQGIDVVGPLPADTVFTPRYTEQADIIMSMYHDQGLPVLKSQGFGDAANITLGLPILRSSVDHGTAFDLAGSGKADTGGLQTAIAVMRQMVQSLG